MNNFSALQQLEKDLYQLEKTNDALKTTLHLDVKVNKTSKEPMLKSFNIELIEFEDVEIPFFGI